MSYNPYNQGPGAEAGHGYGQPEQHEMHSYPQQSYGSPQQQYGQDYGQGQYGTHPEQQQYGSPQPQQYGSPQPNQQQDGAQFLSQNEFLQRISAIRQDIKGLTTSIGNIATLHQQTLASSDNGPRQQLDDLVAATQLKNTSIRSQIQQLKSDTERTTDGTFNLKKRQFETINGEFKDTIQRFLQEEQQYRERNREQIARHYRIMNADATEEEVQQAVEADWGDEGIFQAALRTNRTGHATTVLGNVRARHNDMVKIEKSIIELLELLEILNQQIVQQGQVIQQISDNAEQTTGELGKANVKIEQGVKSSRNRRKLKWWCFLVVVLIVLAIAIGVGIGVAVQQGLIGSAKNNNQ
ncbi:t-SNARE [Chaetomium sp. MPI-SDFR-AT-0129]|nr:t-SNARE [Chaetomium sp. MPI-SDFR-AT-0129]